jgi:hypothetical protein
LLKHSLNSHCTYHQFSLRLNQEPYWVNLLLVRNVWLGPSWVSVQIILMRILAVKFCILHMCLGKKLQSIFVICEIMIFLIKNLQRGVHSPPTDSIFVESLWYWTWVLGIEINGSLLNPIYYSPVFSHIFLAFFSSFLQGLDPLKIFWTLFNLLSLFFLLSIDVRNPVCFHSLMMSFYLLFFIRLIWFNDVICKSSLKITNNIFINSINFFLKVLLVNAFIQWRDCRHQLFDS